MVLSIKQEVQQVLLSGSIFRYTPMKISMGSMSPVIISGYYACELRGKGGQKTYKCKRIVVLFDFKCGEGHLNSAPMTKLEHLTHIPQNFLAF